MSPQISKPTHTKAQVTKLTVLTAELASLKPGKTQIFSRASQVTHKAKKILAYYLLRTQ